MEKPANGKFSLKYFLFGKGLPDWISAWGSGWRIVMTLTILFFIVITIYRAFFKKDQTQSQHLNVWPLSFSTVTYTPQQSQKQVGKKRAWWLPTFFAEGYGFSETSNNATSRTGIGARIGGRFEL